MNLNQGDTAAKTTVATTDKPSVIPEADTVQVMKQHASSDQDCSETAIYLDKIVLNSDLDWF